jgi:hypothetical protein
MSKYILLYDLLSAHLCHYKQAYVKTLKEKDFTTENIRQTAKGWKVAKVHTATIWY